MVLPNSSRRKKILVLGIACCAALAATVIAFRPGSGLPALSSAAPPPPLDGPFDSRLQYALDRISDAKLPVIVAISHANAPLRLHEFGELADDNVDAAMTQIDINSVTKTVTAVMAAKLVDQGRLRFDETLSEVFSGVPDDKAAITLHELLTHSAGFVESVGDDAELIGKAEFLDRAFRSRLQSAPGDIYNYSNVGYGLIAAIIEERSGKTYEDYLQQDVLSGLGFENTGYASVYDKSRSLKTRRGQDIWEASWGGHAPSWNLIGNGGLVSTAPEMLRFRQALLQGKILQPETLSALHVAHVAEDSDATSHYGYGLVVQDVESVGRIYWHDGGNDLFSAQWGDYSTQDDLIFVAGLDTAQGNAFEAMHILETYLYGRRDE